MPKHCVVIHAAEAAEGRTGVTYAAGISSASAGASALSLQMATLPPGGRSRAHRHDEHESAAYVIEGEMVLRYGQRLEHEVRAQPGSFLYIPSGVPHAVFNESDSAPAVAVLARTDPNEHEDVTELPELQAALDARRVR